MTPLQLANQIATRLKKYIQDPNVSVVLTQINSKKVFLLGEVQRRGPVDMTPGMTVLQAIASAGGLTDFADTKKIYILRDEAGNHQKIPVRYKEALKGASELNLVLKPGAQVVPEATAGPAIVQYAFRYSQSGAFLSGNQTSLQTNASAEVDYANGFKRYPFNLNYGGGYTWTLSGPSYATGVFQRLLISQGYIGSRWNIFASDNVYYLPQSPTMGFSGIPGTGEPIGGSGSNPPSSQPILTVNTTVVNNVATGEIGRSLNYATTLSVGGTSQILRQRNDGQCGAYSAPRCAEFAYRSVCLLPLWLRRYDFHFRDQLRTD